MIPWPQARIIDSGRNVSRTTEEPLQTETQLEDIIARMHLHASTNYPLLSLTNGGDQWIPHEVSRS